MHCSLGSWTQENYFFVIHTATPMTFVLVALYLSRLWPGQSHVCTLTSFIPVVLYLLLPADGRGKLGCGWVSLVCELKS